MAVCSPKLGLSDTSSATKCPWTAGQPVKDMSTEQSATCHPRELNWRASLPLSRIYYIEQGIIAITALLGHLREPNSYTGKMMRIELQWCQVQAGTSFNLLEEPRIPVDYIEGCWIMHLRNISLTRIVSTLTLRAPIYHVLRATMMNS